jgi:hypothetical protein
MTAANSVLSICFVATLLLAVGGLATNAGETADGAVVKHILDGERTGTNVLKPSAWRPYESGFTKTNDVFVCDNGTAAGRRVVWRRVELNQKSPQPIVASVWSNAENMSGGRDSDYSLYLDLQYADGTPLWGQPVLSCGCGARVLEFPTRTQLLYHADPTRGFEWPPEDAVDRDLDIAISQLASGAETVKDGIVHTAVGVAHYRRFGNQIQPEPNPLGSDTPIGTCLNCQVP